MVANNNLGAMRTLCVILPNDSVEYHTIAAGSKRNEITEFLDQQYGESKWKSYYFKKTII